MRGVIPPLVESRVRAGCGTRRRYVVARPTRSAIDPQPFPFVQ
ncbi:hypothetical protein BURMUCF2_A0716 [Burkholderia multivorans CF2]|nr:hypothetical protein BURMUCF2_A0716 [Burkholderia multivorans CF2]